MKKQFDLILAGGLVATGRGIERLDVGVRKGKIAGVGKNLPTGAGEVIDARGKYLLPGVIDVHIHPVYLDNVGDCSEVAAYGGTTTLLHFAYARTGESLVREVKKMMKDCLRTSRLDFSLHGGLFEAAKQVPEIPEVMKMGVKTFKFFLAYMKQGWYTDDYQLTKAMDILVKNGGMAMIHGENGGAIDFLEDKFFPKPSSPATNFNLSRPAALEEEAVFRAIRIAEVTDCPLYIAHVTTERVLKHICRAQAEGQKVYAETCPQYLNLTEEIIKEKGALAKIGPPIRSKADRLALWRALRDGVLNVVSSDHAPKTKDVKGNFLEQGFGSPQIETVLPLTYDEGVNKGRISLVRLVQVLSENPARIFGLYPRKGTIAVGSDADLVVYDPSREFTIKKENQHSHAGYTLYEGRTVLGWPIASFQRGEKILWEGKIVAKPGRGRFLPTLKTHKEPIAV